MRKGWFCFSFIILLSSSVSSSFSQDNVQYATGVVYHDRNKNRIRDAGEEGIRGVRVSNQREIVKTDSKGHYKISVTDDCILFVIKPRGWMNPLSEHNLPQFYYIHKPNGSPPNFRYPGVAPTGPLPESVDFPLYAKKEPDKFRVLLFGDTQPRDQKEVDYIAHDVVEELIGKTDAKFGVTMGDIVFDDLDVMEPLNKVIALIGIPWYNVLGNHDINYDADHDEHSDETFERIYGPSYYSFDYGPVHFIVLDDVAWTGKTSERAGFYGGGFGPKQIEFIKNDLALIPKDQMVVLMMHIPLIEVQDRKELYRMIEKRPFALSISAHTHYQEHRFIKREDGWEGPEPHHHVIAVTVCGSWWTGAPDERGIPHATMRDGAPNGYSLITFDGKKYSIEFKAAGRPADYQMNIYAPEEVAAAEAGSTEILVNVFAGSERSVVEMRLGDKREWIKMDLVRIEDPAYARMKQLEQEFKLPGRALPGVMKSPHIWRATLPTNPPKGTHPLQVRTTDMFGKTYTSQRIIRIR
jgi:hypothetical protein